MSPKSIGPRLTESDDIKIAKISKASYNKFVDKEIKAFFFDEFGKEKGLDSYRTIKFKERRVHLCAKEGGRIIGALVLRIEHRCASIGAFVVVKDMRGRGIGTKLIKECIRIAKLERCRKLWLWTLPGTDAHGFYKKLGFAEEARLKMHFGGEKDLSMMSMFF